MHLFKLFFGSQCSVKCGCESDLARLKVDHLELVVLL